MHEVSLAGGILQMVEAAAEREGFVRATRLRLEVGALAGVDIEALRFACNASFAGTMLDQAEIVIDTPAASAWCMACARSVAIMHRLDPCPDCGGAQLIPNGGTELKVVDMQVQDSVPNDEIA